MPENAPQQRPELVAGNYAPEFTLATDDGGTFTLSAQKGKHNVVLYFYPKDDTPGCTLEAQDFRDKIDAFKKEETIIVGISKNTLESHKKFKDKHCLPFPLASDREETVCEAFDCWVEKNMYGKKYMGIQRDTFLIDKTGRIEKVWRKVKVEGHAKEVLEAVKELNG